MERNFLRILMAVSLINPELRSVCITIWVHGTYPALSVLRASWSPIRKMVYVEPGLSLAKELPKNYYFAKLAQQLSERDGNNYDLDHFYTYGWHSSNVRPGHRIAEGRLLYERLQELLKNYSRHDEIIIRCIGFSHGGNVILNMLPHLPFMESKVKVEVILLATPIQESTRSYINCPYISKAYSVYSDGDWIQRIDAQRFHHNCPKGASFWSQRTFKDEDCVKQVCLKVNGKNIGHAKYRYFLQHLPDMLQQIESRFQQQTDTKKICLNYVIPR